ncbi:MAG: TadE/TadG family type IV pilus assembly protein [Acidimicrobiia bacterium]
MTRRFRRRVERGERGAALVEFALILPLFLTLVLGMFSGGLAYSRKITLTNAAREGARYGATLAPSTVLPPSATCCGIDYWVTKVADAVEQNAEGDLDAGVDGREICVAYVYPAADANPSNVDAIHREKSHMVVRTTSDTTSFGPTARCIANDGLGTNDRRVQVTVQRGSEIQLLFVSYDVTLTAQSVTRFEATSF